MATFVVSIYSRHLRCTTHVVGLFASRAEAQKWGEDRDYKLKEEEVWGVIQLSAPDSILRL